MKVGGVPLVDLELETLRREVALVTQEQHVFVGTLADNLRLASVRSSDEELLAARTAGKVLSFLNRLNQTKVLILDDYGLRSYSHEEATFLVELLEARGKKGPVIVTSQVDPAGWEKLYEDPVIAEAIVDRIKNPSQKITLKGGSYRERLGAANRIEKSLAEKPAIQ